jgi:hypothetical protein
MSHTYDKKTLELFADYADKHGIYDKFNYILSRVLLARPADPFQFMIDILQRPPSNFT